MDPGIISVTSAGRVTALSVGMGFVRATVDGRHGTARIQVGIAHNPVRNVELDIVAATLNEGAQLRITATTRGGLGEVLPGRLVTWTTNHANVATVSLDGLVTAVNAGFAVITATSEGIFGNALIEVVRPAVASVVLGVTPAVLNEGDSHQLVATVRDANGEILLGRALQWSSSDPSIANVSSGGLVTALRPGTVTLTVRVEGQSAGAPIRVESNLLYDLLYDAFNAQTAAMDLYAIDVRDPSHTPVSFLPDWYSGSEPSPSPNGMKVAFARSGIHIIGRDGSRLVQLTAGDDDQPAWSPDGSQIAFRRRQPSGGTDIWVANVADGSESILTADQGIGNEGSPAWSPRRPDGTYRIVYARSRGDSHLWTMWPDGSGKVQITTGASWNDEPSWSPDGLTIVFTRSQVGTFGDLFLISPNGTNLRKLMPGYDLPLGQFGPTWSPDGTRIAFTANLGGDLYQVYTVWADGSRLARRTFDGTNKRNAAWAPRH
jgi:Tol biopolymer transport system component